MLTYPSFIYLQNQKTGCTYVEACLRRFCSEPLLEFDKHATLRSAPKKFCFINVREPLSLYRSLFAYGREGRGTVFLRFRSLKLDYFYASGESGFPGWLEFMLDPRNSTYLANGYNSQIANNVGFMTWRFLRLACYGYEDAAARFSDIDGMRNFIRERYVINAVLHQERLKDDLLHLLTGRLARSFQDQEGLARWIQNSERVNASSKRVDDTAVDQSLIDRIYQKERFLYQNFYPKLFG